MCILDLEQLPHNLLIFVLLLLGFHLLHLKDRLTEQSPQRRLQNLLNNFLFSRREIQLPVQILVTVRHDLVAFLLQ